MKITRAISAAILLGVLLLASCYWNPASQTGSLTLQSPAGALPKGVGPYPAATHYRVYLLADGVQIPIGSSSYSYSAISSSMTIKDLSVGPEYTVLVSIGAFDASAGYFDVWYYGHSDPVEINAGGDKSVSIALTESPFENTALLGSDVTGLAIVNGEVYASTSSQVSSVLSLSPVDANDNTSSLGLTGYTVNSLSVGIGSLIGGSQQLWANTNKGIVPFNGEGWDTNFSQQLNVDGDVSVLQSGAFGYGSELATEPPFDVVFAFFQRPAGLGGVPIEAVNEGNPAAWSWINVDLSQFLSGKPILDFTTTSKAVYFATKLGTFRLTKAILEDTGFDPADVSAMFNTFAQFISVPGEGGALIPIQCLAVDQASSKIYLGTQNGAWEATLTEDSTTGAIADGSLTAIPGTAGEKISMISLSPDGNWLAFLSSDSLFVKDLSGGISEYPFYSGLPSDVPGDLTTLAWADDGANMRILVAGRRGVVSKVVYETNPQT